MGCCILRRNCLLKYIIEGEIRDVKATTRRRRRGKQLLDDINEMKEYWKLKEDAPDRTLRKTRFGGDYGSFV
jgi:CRISPR/Cas system-associated exonuclease Cas4 (RecB family)